MKFAFFITIITFSAYSYATYTCKSKQILIEIQAENRLDTWSFNLAMEDASVFMKEDSIRFEEEKNILEDSSHITCFGGGSDATFPGGEEAFSRYVNENLKTNKIDSTVNVAYCVKCYVQFIIDENGKTQDVSILKSTNSCPSMDEEVLRVINSMPLWIPGEYQGEKIAVKYIIPVQIFLH